MLVWNPWLEKRGWLNFDAWNLSDANDFFSLPLSVSLIDPFSGRTGKATVDFLQQIRSSSTVGTGRSSVDVAKKTQGSMAIQERLRISLKTAVDAR